MHVRGFSISSHHAYRHSKCKIIHLDHFLYNLLQSNQNTIAYAWIEGLHCELLRMSRRLCSFHTRRNSPRALPFATYTGLLQLLKFYFEWSQDYGQLIRTACTLWVEKQKWWTNKIERRKWWLILPHEKYNFSSDRWESLNFNSEWPRRIGDGLIRLTMNCFQSKVHRTSDSRFFLSFLSRISCFESYRGNELCLQKLSFFVLNMAITNGSVTRWENGKDHNHRWSQNNTHTQRYSTRGLARAIDLGQLDTPTFVWRGSVLC